MRTILLLAVALLAGCSTLASTGATVNDALLADSEFMLCKGVSVGSWLRAYGSDPAKAGAWRVLCGASVTQTPLK